MRRSKGVVWTVERKSDASSLAILTEGSNVKLVEAAERRTRFFAGIWSWIAYGFATPAVTARDNPQRKRGPWDGPRYTVYVSGCEVCCVVEPGFTGGRTHARPGYHSGQNPES